MQILHVICGGAALFCSVVLVGKNKFDASYFSTSTFTVFQQPAHVDKIIQTKLNYSSDVIFVPHPLLLYRLLLFAVVHHLVLHLANHGGQAVPVVVSA